MPRRGAGCPGRGVSHTKHTILVHAVTPESTWRTTSTGITETGKGGTMCTTATAAGERRQVRMYQTKERTQQHTRLQAQDSSRPYTAEISVRRKPLHCSMLPHSFLESFCK